MLVAKPLRQIRNQKGQALIESLVAIPLLAAAVGAGAFYSYRGVQYFLIQNTLQESLLCLDTQTYRSCRSQLETSAKKVAVFGEKIEIELSSGKTGRRKGSVQLNHSSLPTMIVRQSTEISSN